MIKFIFSIFIFLLPFLSSIVTYYATLNINHNNKFIRPGFMYLVLCLLPLFCLFNYYNSQSNKYILSLSVMLFVSALVSIVGYFLAISEKFTRGYSEIFIKQLNIKESIVSSGPLLDGYLYFTDKYIIHVYFDWEILDLSYDIILYNSITSIKKQSIWDNILIYTVNKKYELCPKYGVDCDNLINAIKEVVHEYNDSI